MLSFLSSFWPSKANSLKLFTFIFLITKLLLLKTSQDVIQENQSGTELANGMK